MILPIFSITDHNIFLKHLIFLHIWKCVQKQPCQSRATYFPASLLCIDGIAQPQLGSLGMVKPVFWGRIRPTDYMQSKQATPAKPRVSKSFQVYCPHVQQCGWEVWSSLKTLALYHRATAQSSTVLGLNSIYEWALVEKNKQEASQSRALSIDNMSTGLSKDVLS